MSNVWNCNYPLWQGGVMHFDYSFMSHGAALPLFESARFGWDAVSPLIAHWTSASPERQSPAAFSFKVEPQNVMITAVKLPEAGSGTVIRVWECGGQANTCARIEIIGRRVAAVRKLNLVEEDAGPAILVNGAIEAELQPYGLHTFLIKFAG
jgi:alpha-mannosidase